MMLMGNNGGDGDDVDVDPESVLETENGPREEPRTPVPAASTELLLRELGNVKMRGRVRKLPKYLTLSQMVEERMPTKVGVLQVMRFAGRRSAIWQNQLLVLCGNTIAIFPTTYGPEDEEVLTRIFREKKSARRKLRSEIHFDLSEPDLSVSVALSAAVHRQPGEIATAQDSQHSYEWTISVPRYRGLLLVRLRSPSAEDRDQWVSAMRAFESRVSTSFSAFRPKSLSVETSRNAALPSSRKSAQIPRRQSSTRRYSNSKDTAKALPLPDIKTVDGLAGAAKTTNSQPKSRRWGIPKFRRRKGAPNGSTLRSPRSPALRKVHSEARFDAAALHTIKKIATPPKDEEDESFTFDLVRAMQDRFSSASDYIVYSDQEKIVARRQDVTNCLADYLIRTSHEHSYTPDQTVAEEILRDHDWNLRAAMLAVLQVPSPRETSQSTTQDTPDTSLHVTTCAICFENFGVDESNEDPTKEATSLRCGHAFCRGCWTANISCRIRDGKACLCTECMAPGCRERATAAFVRQHAESDELRERFDRLYADAFVDSCETVRWCPQSGCGNAVEWKLAEDTNTSQSTATSAKHETDMCARSVHCSCGFKFCFDCGSESHAPATCEQVEAWHQVLVAAEEARQVKAAPRKEQEQVMAKRWILNNARPCPKCKVPIEKMQGCNHMVCSSCKHEYCWACLGPWTDHSTETGGFFRCKIADERTDEVLARQDAARTAMQQDFAQTRDRALEERKQNAEQEEAFRKANQLRKRVAHFVKQYDQHDAIAQWAQNVSQDFDRALENETQILGPQRALVDFLQKILRVLADCRAMLKWVVVVSYFLNAESSTAANWVFGLDELKERLPLKDTVSIDGPHRALFAAKLGACVQLADRLQHAVEGPALSIGLDDANATRAKLWKKSPWARQRVRKALELATVLAPLQSELSTVSCQALERLQEVLRLAEVTNGVFPRLSRPLLEKLERPVDGQSDKEPLIVAGSLPQRWICTLCGWQNQQEAKCQACSNVGVTNHFARCRLGLFQQVRRCVGCSAELSLADRFESPCPCSASALSVCPGRRRYLGKSISSSNHGGDDLVVGKIDLVCPECERKVLQGGNPSETATQADLEEVALLEVLEEPPSAQEHHSTQVSDEISASSQGDLEVAQDQASFTCREGHALSFEESLIGVFECDACCEQIQGPPGTCLTCNSVLCKPCAHLQRYADQNRNSSSTVGPRRRRNAVIYSSPESFQAHLTRDSQPRRRARSHVEPGRGARASSLRSLGSNTRDVRSLSQPSGWECGECTFWNLRESSRVCEICNSPRTWRQNSTQTHDASMQNLVARHDAETDQDEDVDDDDDLTLVDDEDDLESSSGTGLTYFQQHPTPRNQRRVPRRPRAGAFDGAMQSPDRRRIDFSAQGIASRNDNTNDSDSESMVSLDDDAVANPPRVSESDSLQFFRTSLDNLRLDNMQSQTSRMTRSTSLFSPRTDSSLSHARFGKTLAESLVPAPPFLSVCQSHGQELGTRCLTLLKPLRRDALRLQESPLVLHRAFSMEVWWETRCTGTPGFSCIRVTLELTDCSRNVVFTTAKDVPDVGTCMIHVPALCDFFDQTASQNASSSSSLSSSSPDQQKEKEEGNSKNLRLTVRLEACDVDSQPLLAVSTPSFPVIGKSQGDQL